MASLRIWRCQPCDTRVKAENLFDAVMAVSRNSHKSCPTCGKKLDLQITFPFGLNAQNNTFTVLAVYFPKNVESWHDQNGNKVEFYPFLIIGDRSARRKAVWLPYWHLHYTESGVKKKYGQWAPFMDAALFSNLLLQAQTDKLLPK